MRKYFSIGIALLCLFAASSCKNKGPKAKDITSKEITALVQDSLTNIDCGDLATVAVGYYEENCASNREKLRMLASLGVVNYQAEEIFDSNNQFHVFVEVSLTSEGKKYIYNPQVTKVESPKEEIDPDMVNRFANENQKVESPGEESVVAVNPISAQETYTVTEPKKKEPAKYASEVASKELDLYELAKAHEQKTIVKVVCQKKTIFKVRNIKCDVKKADSIANAATEMLLKKAQEAIQDSVCYNAPSDDVVITESRKGVVVEKIVVECNKADVEKIQSLLNGDVEKKQPESACTCSSKKQCQKKDAKAYNIEPVKPVYCASAEVIVETTEVSPFGRVYGNYVKGEKKLYACDFTFDEGWKLVSLKECKKDEKSASQQSATEENASVEVNEESEEQTEDNEQIEFEETKNISKVHSKINVSVEQFEEDLKSYEEETEAVCY